MDKWLFSKGTRQDCIHVEMSFQKVLVFSHSKKVYQGFSFFLTKDAFVFVLDFYFLAESYLLLNIGAKISN